MSRMFENGIEDFCCPGSVGEGPWACGENAHRMVCCDVMAGAVTLLFSFPAWDKTHLCK